MICSKVQESEAWHQARTNWSTYRRAIFGNLRLFFYLVVLMAMMNFMSHGTQDVYPTLLGTIGYSKARIADVTRSFK